MSELRGTTQPFTSLQSAVSKNMVDSLKVGLYDPASAKPGSKTSCIRPWGWEWQAVELAGWLAVGAVLCKCMAHGSTLTLLLAIFVGSGVPRGIHSDH